MKEIVTYRYVAIDGRVFDSAKECAEWEMDSLPETLIERLGGKRFESLPLDFLLDEGCNRTLYYKLSVTNENIERLRELFKYFDEEKGLYISKIKNSVSQFLTVDEVEVGFTYVISYNRDCDFVGITSCGKLMATTMEAMKNILGA